MPALPLTRLLNELIDSSPTSPAANTTASDAVGQIICAYPLSGQYGPGSRIFAILVWILKYYLLVAACVFARRELWLRDACLAAALLIPAIAAIHAIVLAALHVDGAVDMDIYGAFQFCSIGILAAPVAVKVSRTYFYDPGRNAIFVWTGLLFMGLLSLTVEFFRSNPTDCVDASNNLILWGNFSYGTTTCNLTCDVNNGPFSVLRTDAANNIYVIPTPAILNFGTASLLSAACCIPAILSLVSMWNKILQINWKTRFGNRGEERTDEPIEGTNGATIGKLKKVESVLRLFLTVVEVPFFGVAVLAIIIFGERNFWSPQVVFQTEPMNFVGQWSPIVGTGLAAGGSLYLLLATGGKETTINPSNSQCNCSRHNVDANEGVFAESFHSVEIVQTNTDHLVPTNTAPSIHATIRHSKHRQKMAKALTSVGSYFSNPALGTFDDSGFRQGKASDFPTVPGEENRNSALPQILERYNPGRDATGKATPDIREQHSRAGSFVGSVTSAFYGQDSSEIPRGSSPLSPRSPNSPSAPSASTPQDPLQSITFPVQRPSFGLHNPPSGSSFSLGGRTRQQRDTLEVPTLHNNFARSDPSASTSTFAARLPEGENSPIIVVSSTNDTGSRAGTPTANSPSP